TRCTAPCSQRARLDFPERQDYRVSNGHADILSGSTALVTGAGGFIGQRLVAYLRSIDVPVIGVGHVARVHSGAEVDYVVDLERPGVLDSWLSENTVVFHLAGSADVRRSVRRPAQDYVANLA